MESPILASMRWILNEQYRRVRKLEEENQMMKEEKEIRALNDRDNLIQIEKLKEENKKLKNLKICWKTVEERIEIDKGVVRDKDE